jgi:hypothetical protein
LQLLALPAGRHDDGADVCGLIGRALDTITPARGPEPARAAGIKPFTAAWLEHTEDVKPAKRYK